MRALCMGEIEEQLIYPYPELDAANKETLREVLGSVDAMLEKHQEDFRKWDEKGEFPESFIEELRQFGMFGLVIPEEHGGLAFGSAAYSRTLQQVARYDAACAVTIGAHSSIGMRGLLLHGSDAQKQRYYAELATGKRIAAFCLTEPGSGSDAGSIRTTAERQGDHWVLNGEKLWITNGGIASFFTVFAKTPSEGKGRMTAFLVTPEMGGVTPGPHENKMGIRASSTTTVSFDNTRVPNDHVLGDVGAGFKVAMHILNNGRTGLGGGSVGAMKKMIALSTVQAKERVQFGKPIAGHQVVAHKLVTARTKLEACRHVLYHAATLANEMKPCAIETSMAKLFIADSGVEIALACQQVMGAYALSDAYDIERNVRDLLGMPIVGGSSDMQRNNLAGLWRLKG